VQGSDGASDDRPRIEVVPLTLQGVQSDGALRSAFEQSKIDRSDWGKYVPMLDTMLSRYPVAPSDVVAVTKTWGFATIFRAGVAHGGKGGMFKGFELGPFVRFDDVEDVTHEADGRFGRKVCLRGLGGRSLLDLKWSSGGPVRPQDVAAEAERIFHAIGETMGLRLD
jgi:hypothetical protein